MQPAGSSKARKPGKPRLSASAEAQLATAAVTAALQSAKQQHPGALQSKVEVQVQAAVPRIVGSMAAIIRWAS
jgi:hypothetical protein